MNNQVTRRTSRNQLLPPLSTSLVVPSGEWALVTSAAVSLSLPERQLVALGRQVTEWFGSIAAVATKHLPQTAPFQLEPRELIEIGRD